MKRNCFGYTAWLWNHPNLVMSTNLLYLRTTYLCPLKTTTPDTPHTKVSTDCSPSHHQWQSAHHWSFVQSQVSCLNTIP